jgi:hypothetical protein
MPDRHRVPIALLAVPVAFSVTLLDLSPRFEMLRRWRARPDSTACDYPGNRADETAVRGQVRRRGPQWMAAVTVPPS